MQYQVKRYLNGVETVVKTLMPQGGQQREAMGVDVVDMTFELAAAFDFQLNDFVDVYGLRYKLNRLPSVQKISKRKFAYTIQFEAEFYDLAKVQYQFLNPVNQLLEPSFDLTGNALTFIDLLVQNANRHSAGWTIGMVDDTEYTTLPFNAQNCLQVLNQLADQFKTEFWIENKTIHLQKREQSSGYTFKYGKGNGLYNINRQNKTNADIFTRLYVRGGSRNLPANYPASALLLPNDATYIQDNAKVAQYGLIEATLILADIFPERIGTVTGIVGGNDNWMYFFDSALNFDVTEQAAPGLEAKIHFNSGQLAGYSFTFSYNHSLKRFTLNKNTEEANLDIPSNILRPAIGDKYVLLDIIMPQSYVDDAVTRLQTASSTHYNQNSDPKFLLAYSASCDSLFISNNNIQVVLGNTAILEDDDLAINTELRISKYIRDLQTPDFYSTLEWSDTIGTNEIVRQYQQQQKTLLLLESSGLLDPAQMRRALFLNRLSEQNGYLMLSGVKVKAGIADYAVEAGHAYLASEAINSDLWDAKQFADYLNQPVRDTDDVAFKSVKSKNFVSGAFGSGFRINENGDAEFDNLFVRKAFTTTELVLQKIRASNGAIAVTDAGVLGGINMIAPGYFEFSLQDDNVFEVGDILKCQVFSNTSTKSYTLVVENTAPDKFTAYADIDTAFEVGDTLVRIGSVSNANRRGLIYMTNADSGAPFIDVLDGVNSATFVGKTKVRLGKLDGIVDADLGALSGYGIYAQNGFFKGKVIITGGNAQTIAGAQAQANTAQANAIAAASSDATIKANAALTSAAADATAKANAAEANAQAMVNAVKIGGRNLFIDGSFERGIAFVSSSRGLTPSIGIGDIDANPSFEGLKCLRFHKFEHTAFTDHYLFLNQVLSLEVGEEYTLSFYYKCAGGISGNSSYMYVDGVPYYMPFVWTYAGYWQKAQYTFTAIGEEHFLRFGFTSISNIQAWMCIDAIKLEKGNKATDWTPANEEVEAAINAAQAAANAAQAANTALTNSLKAMAYKDVVELAELGTTIIQGGKIKTNLLDADYIKANIINAAYINALEIDASAIRSGIIDSARINASQIVVAGGGATQAYAQSLVNGVAVGGRNYYRQTSVLTGYDTATQPLRTSNGFTFVGLQNVLGVVRINNVIDSNGLWTVSFRCRINNSTAQIQVDICDRGVTSFDLVPDVWNDISITVLVDNYGDGSVYNFVDLEKIGWRYYEIELFKVEKGNKATDWTPAPEDVTAAINDAKTTAQTNAVSIAAADATAKANAAQSVAEALVNALKVGGRNLLVGSSNGIGWECHYSGSEFRRTGSLPYETAPYIYSQNFLPQAGREFVFSFEAKQSSNIDSVDFFILGNYSVEGFVMVSQYPLSSEWTLHVFKGVVPNTIVSPVQVRFDHNGSNDGQPATIYVRNVKFEYGNKVTDWTPAPEDVDTAISAAQAAANAAQAANTALTNSLKAMAYKDVVELAELGTTIIQGGKIKTTLLDADYIKSNIVNAAYITALDIAATKLAANEGFIGGFKIVNSSLVAGSNSDNPSSWDLNSSNIMLYTGYQLFRKVGDTADQTDEMAINLGYYSASSGLSYKDTLVLKNNILNTAQTYMPASSLNGSGAVFRQKNRALILEAKNSDENIALEVMSGHIYLRGVNDAGTVNQLRKGYIKYVNMNGRQVLVLDDNPTEVNITLYGNIAQTANVQYSPCDVGEVGTNHSYTTPANTFKRMTQLEANDAAYQHALQQAQSAANNYGYCQLPVYRILVTINYDAVTYEVKDVQGNAINLPVDVVIYFNVSTNYGSNNSSATIYTYSGSSGYLFFNGEQITDFWINYYNPTQYNGVDINVEYQ